MKASSPTFTVGFEPFNTTIAQTGLPFSTFPDVHTEECGIENNELVVEDGEGSDDDEADSMVL